VTDKPERPLYLNMPFDEALTRYIGTKAEEVEPPAGRKRKAARPKPGGSVDGNPPPPAKGSKSA
jgi:hypothetical protein